MYSNCLSKMFGASLKALKVKHLGKKLNFSQNSTVSSKFGEEVKIPHLTEALQASKCTSDTRLSFGYTLGFYESDSGASNQMDELRLRCNFI